MFSYDLDEVTYFWQDYGRNHTISLTVHNTRGFVMSLGLITGDVIHPEHVNDVMFAVFLYCKATIFTFAIYKYLEGETLRLCKYSISPHFLPANFSIHERILSAAIITMAFTQWFFFYFPFPLDSCYTF